ncbi:MAG: STAS domain-containing protein, partial [Pseudomonadota bacterium]|nr:STAS domain-containing protein [Pseudomonadota bacterium]
MTEHAPTLPDAPAAVEPADGLVRCTGCWTLEGIAGLARRLKGLRWPEGEIVLDGAGVAAMDTTGAQLLLELMARLARDGRAVRLESLRPGHQALLELVRQRLTAAGETAAPEPALGGLAALGRLAWSHLEQGLGFVAFVGEAAIGLGRALLHPGRIRWKALLA